MTTFGKPSTLLNVSKDASNTASFGKPSSLLVPSTIPNGFGKHGPLLEVDLNAPPPTDDTPVQSEPTCSSVPATPAPSLSRSDYTSRSSAYVRGTTFEGKPVNIRRKPKVSHAARNKLALGTSASRMGTLLDVPIHRLMDKLSRDTATLLQRPKLDTSPSSSGEVTLWVDRYKPERFTELTGNERVARETMTWVKQWDWCVFGKRKGKKRAREGDENDDLDEYHRPKEKLMLLSGPPGLGKTTLAHVVARHAGYEVMEVNASDARSGNEVEDRLRPALEAGSAVGSKKPVLLVLDEIDGATGSGDNSGTFIHKLIQLTIDKPRKKRRNGQDKSDQDSRRPILRPIICICNDYNAASLAKLRPHVFHIRFTRPADVHTVKRLREVCELEGLSAEPQALSTLVGAARGDLRGCLNTLQFIKSRHTEVTQSIVRSATLGLKEAETSVLSVLNNLFSPLSKKRVKELCLSEEEEARYVGRLSKEIDASGRESGIANGCFAHYVTRRQHDANFDRYEKASEWLTTFDRVSARMYNEGDFAISPYLPFLLVPFYPLFQERGAPAVERNQDDWEHLQATRANEEIYKSLNRCLRTAHAVCPGSFRTFMNYPILQLEFSPYINRIISPPLRPINQQVVKPGERETLTRLVNIMSSLELRFVQERGEDGQLAYRLDPPIDVFVTYDGKRASDLAVSRYALRHLVAGEIDAKLGSRNSEIMENGRPGKGSRNIQSSPNKPSNASDEPPQKRTKTTELDVADKPPVDFFGRPITTTTGLGKSRSGPRASSAKKQFGISFRYAEGNSAAVRRPIMMKSFL